MMRDAWFTVFPTALGICAVVWGEHGIVGVELPADEHAIRTRLRKRFPASAEWARAESALPVDIARAIDGITALLAGERRDLTDVAVDMTTIDPFDRRVLEVTRAIPPGETLTYGEVAARIGLANAAREVGGALGRNPFPIVVPCHRVLAAGGKTGGFSGTGGVGTKLRLLGIERSAGPLFDGVID